MRNAPSSENLTLRVEDFGPIIEAEIDLRPLTVFAGPSNTGKSWLAMLIYALHQHFESVCDKRTDFFIQKLTKGFISEKEIVSIVDWANSEIFSKKKTTAEGIEHKIDLPGFIMRSIHKYIDESNRSIIDQICRAFGVDNKRNFIRNTTRYDRMSISIIKTVGDLGLLHQRSILRGDEFTKQTSEFPDASSSIDIDALKSTLTITQMIGSRDPDDFDVLRKCSELLSTIASQYISPWFEPLNGSAYYFPTDRAGMMHTHRAIVSAIVGNADSAGLRSTKASTTQISGVMADFLQHLISIDSRSYRKKPSRFHHEMENHGVEIEKNIVGGRIGIKRSALIDYPEFTYQPKGWKALLSLNNASSMVSELIPIILFLRHKVTKGNTLIIEEPEAHLHPEMQVELTQQLAALVQSGIRVILITHSDWVLQTLANIVYASDLTDKQRSYIPTAKIALKSEQVGVWQFKQKKSPKGSVVEEIQLDPNCGLYDSDYDPVSERLYLDNAFISNSIRRRSA